MMSGQRLMSENYVQPVKHDDAATLDPEEFLHVYQLAMHAMALPESARMRAVKGLPIKGEGTEVTRLRPADIPMNRAAFAVLDYYGSDSGKFQSTMWRLLGLMDIFEDEALLASRTRETENGREISGAVVMAAAVVPLGADGKFPRAEFVEAIDRIEEEAGKEPD